MCMVGACMYVDTSSCSGPTSYSRLVFLATPLSRRDTPDLYKMFVNAPRKTAVSTYHSINVTSSTLTSSLPPTHPSIHPPSIHPSTHPLTHPPPLKKAFSPPHISQNSSTRHKHGCESQLEQNGSSTSPYTVRLWLGSSSSQLWRIHHNHNHNH